MSIYKDVRTHIYAGDVCMNKNYIYQDIDVIDGKETSKSSTGASVPLVIHLLYHAHNISCTQTQLFWTLCANNIQKYMSKISSNFQIL